MRAMQRNESDAPMEEKSSTETDDPNLPTPPIDTAAAMREKDRMDKDDPTLAKSSTDSF
jgi:hypothetical protein